MTMAMNTINPGVDTSFSTKLNQNYNEVTALAVRGLWNTVKAGTSGIDTENMIASSSQVVAPGIAMDTFTNSSIHARWSVQQGQTTGGLGGWTFPPSSPVGTFTNVENGTYWETSTTGASSPSGDTAYSLARDTGTNWKGSNDVLIRIVYDAFVNQSNSSGSSNTGPYGSDGADSHAVIGFTDNAGTYVLLDKLIPNGAVPNSSATRTTYTLYIYVDQVNNRANVYNDDTLISSNISLGGLASWYFYFYQDSSNNSSNPGNSYIRIRTIDHWVSGALQHSITTPTKTLTVTAGSSFGYANVLYGDVSLQASANNGASYSTLTKDTWNNDLVEGTTGIAQINMYNPASLTVGTSALNKATINGYLFRFT